MISACLLAAALQAFALPPESEDLRRRGYDVAETVTESIGGKTYTALFYRASDATRGGQVDIYVDRTMIYTHPTLTAAPTLEESQPKRRFSTIFKDGVKTLVYRTADDQTSTLFVLRLEGVRFKRAGVFPEGRLQDLDGDGKPEVIERKPPQGPTMIKCAEFRASAASARVTELYAWNGKTFERVTAKFPAFFARRLAADRQAVASAESGRLNAPGRYASAVLTLYFDEKAGGKPREAWNHLNTLIETNAKHPAVKAWSHGEECVVKLRVEARERLAIPKDW